MDISKASNLERFIFELVGREPERVVAAWRDLDAQGYVDFSSELARFTDEFGFVSGTSTHDDRLATIRAVHERTGEVIDPHTADGVRVARDHVRTGETMLVLETAKPEKFAETIREAIGIDMAYEDDVRAMLEAPQFVVEMPDDADALRAFIAEHALR